MRWLHIRHASKTDVQADVHLYEYKKECSDGHNRNMYVEIPCSITVWLILHSGSKPHSKPRIHTMHWCHRHLPNVQVLDTIDTFPLPP